MIEITDADLMDNNTPFRTVFLLIQMELDVAVFTGAGAVLVTAGERLEPLVGFDVETRALLPIEESGFTGVVNDLHLSRIFASWTTERGGALRLRATFEEEGIELRGGLIDLDLDHMHLDVFLLPSLDSTDTVVWDMQLDFLTDGGVLSDALRGLIEASLLSSGIVTQITDALAPITDQLNLLFGLSTRAVRSIVIEAGRATFDDVSPDIPRFSVVFDAVEVHNDGDGSGQGELRFIATVGETDVQSTEDVSAGSGTVVPLEGAQWRVSPELVNGRSVSVRFEALEADGDNLRSLGVVDVDLDPDDAPLVLELPSSRNDFTLLARLEPRDVEPPARARHLQVSVPNVRILHDQDTTGAGEVRFWALAAGQPTGVSEEAKARGGGNPDIDPALSVDFHLPAGEDLDLRMIGWDVDPSQRDWMGEIVAVVPAGDIAEVEPLVLESDTGDFEATITVVDLDAPPDDDDDGGGPIFPPGTETLQRLVVLESLTVGRDGDDVGPGELRITARLTRSGTDAVVTMHNDLPIETSADEVLPLVGEAWRSELEVAVAGRLTVTASVVDVDVTPDDPFTPQNEASETETPLGTATLTFDADEDHGLGRHVLASDDGNVRFRLLILDPAAQQGEVQAVVRFEEVDILHDHTTPGRAALWCAASVNGFPVGEGTEFKAGNGDTIVLDGSAWEVPVGLDPDEQLELGFEVFEAQDPTHLSLGRVAVGEPLPWPGGRHSIASDTGDFILHYRVWDPTVQDANRLSVTFLEVAVLDDGEPSSEGELRFVGAADELWTGLSVLQKGRNGETLPLVGTSWRLEPELGADDELTVAFTAYAEDADAFARLDRVEQRFDAGDGWGLGEHVVTSPDEKFRIRYAIAPATEEGLPDLPDLVPLLVEFTAVQVNDDGDGLTKGDISCTGTVNGVAVLQTETAKVDAGGLVPLGAALAPRTIWLQSDQDLEIALTASEHDGRQADVLGTSRHVHRAADDWELGPQEIRSPGGAITASWRVDRADGPKARVKFLHVHVFDDDEPVKRGDFVCEATINDVTTGLSLTMKAGSDGASSEDDFKSDIYLGGPRWTKTVAFNPADPEIAVRFTLIELDGKTNQDVLGTVEIDASDAFGAVNDMQSYTQLADSGKYELTLVAQTLGED